MDIILTMTLVTVLSAPPNYSLHLAGENGLDGPNSNYVGLSKEELIEKLTTSLGFSPEEVRTVFVGLEGPDGKYSNWHRESPG